MKCDGCMMLMQSDRRVGEDRVPAVQGVRQPGEGAEVRHHAGRAAERTRLVLGSRLTKEMD